MNLVVLQFGRAQLDNTGETNFHVHGQSAGCGCGSFNSSPTGHVQTWSVAQNVAVFLRSVVAFLETRVADLGHLVFDKDDDLAVEFVTSAANLRAVNYSIPRQSAFTTKGELVAQHGSEWERLPFEACLLCAYSIPFTHRWFLG